MRLPHFRQVITTWGSRLCWVLTRQFIPGSMKALQFLQICRLYSVGSRILAAMAIFLAWRA